VVKTMMVVATGGVLASYYTRFVTVSYAVKSRS
jgi:hypothetical protein